MIRFSDDQLRWSLDYQEVTPVIDEIMPFIQGNLRNSLGTREIGESEFGELSMYWATSLSWHGEISRNKFFSLSPEEKWKFLSFREGSWTRGILEYSEMADYSITDLVEEKLDEKGKASILDIGCGNLYFLREMKEKYGDKIEYCGVANESPTDLGGIDFRHTLAELLPEEWQDTFDLVTCFESSMYIFDNSRAFNESLRVTAPGGRIFYGHGSLKSLGEQKLLERKLGLKNFSFVVPEGHSREGEKYEGLFAKWLEKTYNGFWDLTKDIENGETIHISRYSKDFEINEKLVDAWCGRTVDAKCAY